MLRIGELSRISQVSVKALRFYDEVGLLKPTFVDGATGYRYYSASLLSRLNRILVFKELGFSLGEIALLLSEDLPSEQVREALSSRRDSLSRRISEEQVRLAQVETWLTQLDRQGSGPSYEIALRQIAPQLVASVRESLGSYDEAAELLSELDRHLKKHNAIGRHAAVWHVCAGHAGSIDCEAVVLLNRRIPASKRIAVYERPADINACLIHQGSDETITQAYLAAHSWINTNGYEIDGPLFELYWQGSVARDDASGVTEIRYPILKRQARASVRH